MKRAVLICVLAGLIIPPHPVFAGMNFQGLDLSGDSRLLFRASVGGDSSGGDSPHAVFMSRLTDLALQQITVFPEKIDVVENGRSVLVRSVFGAALVPVSGGMPRHLPGFPSFVLGNVPVGGRADLLAISYDGAWLLLIDPISPAYGNLVLVEIASGRRRLISAQIERPGGVFPACWSPDSRVFVYGKAGKLHYYSLAMDTPVDERYRRIGDGKIGSVSWGRRGDFYYVREHTIYRVTGPEVFTRAVYSDFLEIGAVAGKLPLEFEPDFDSFWMAPDSRSLVFSKGGRNIFYYPLDGTQADNATGEFALPYIKLPPGAFGVNVLWPASGPFTVIAVVPKKDGLSSFAWRLTDEPGLPLNFTSVESLPDGEYALSPDGSRILVWGEQGMTLLDYQSWEPVLQSRTGKVYACAWINNREYISADQWYIEGVDASGGRRLICLSGAQEYGFEEGQTVNRILVKSRGLWHVSDGISPWTTIVNPRVRNASQVSGRYRVYLERQPGFPYENIPMIRNTVSNSTMPLLPQPVFQSEVSNQPVRSTTAGVITRGPESAHREIALCFDLYDDDTGLSAVLEALNRFGVTATFFLNGDFIRRNPESARGIAESGHETASLFYAPVDLSDSRYRIDVDFIVRGLARNEDEYFQATGAELGLLWHPPFYRESAEVAQAAARAGYTTVGRDVDPLDWLSRDDALRLGIRRMSAPQMIERVMERKRPGSIIPVRLGLLPGRNDYLFLNIDVLLDALLRSGYAIVPVSALVQGAR